MADSAVQYLTAMPTFPYRLFVWLVNDDKAEDLWRLLKYNDYDALSKPYLTKQEKIDLLWRDGEGQNSKGKAFFFTNLVEDSIPVERTIIKLYNYLVQPMDEISSVVNYRFEILYGAITELVEWNGVPVSRGDLIAHLLLKVMNGRVIDGVGKIHFNRDVGRYNEVRSTYGNQMNFTGRIMTLSIFVKEAKDDFC